MMKPVPHPEPGDWITLARQIEHDSGDPALALEAGLPLIVVANHGGYVLAETADGRAMLGIGPADYAWAGFIQQ